MLGALLTLVFALGAMGLGSAIVRRWTGELDVAARLGVGGLVGLGTVGLATLPIGLLPGGLSWGVIIVGAAAVAGLGLAWREFSGKVAFALPKGLDMLFPVAITVAGLFSLIGALAPSDTLDWDSLAYHLAVPKLWLADGRIHYVSFIHHSNFPFTIDNLYIWGLSWGGEQGAKSFSFAFLVFGLLTLFGLARQRYGAKAAWWSALALVAIPAVVWLSGTGYIDVSNGLYAGLGIAFAAFYAESEGEKRWMALAAIFLGFAAGSKYTGLQTIIAVGAVLLAFGMAKSSSRGLVKGAFLIGLAAFALASPWYVKNVVNTGNPVYPFFYSVFGGRNWSKFNGEIYTEEQKTFGLPAQVANLGDSILGLAYQPGRYINPSPTQGMGVPVGALGTLGLATALIWCFSGRIRRFEGVVLASVGISLLMWFALSQQSRYIIALSVPLCLLAGGAVTRLKLGPILAALAALQTAYCLYLINAGLVNNEIQVVLGKVSPEDYQKSRIAFYEPSREINTLVRNGKIALFDQVFGYLLDVPYIWANPGHSTELGYDAMQTGDDLVASFRKAGITHVYLDMTPYSQTDPTFQRWMQALGSDMPYTGDERKAMTSDLRNKWKVLVADAAGSHRLTMIRRFRTGILYALAP